MGCLLTIPAPGITEYDSEEDECEADFIEANLDGIESSSICESENLDRRDVAIFIKTTRGKPSLLLNGFKYREIYRTKKGTKWSCSKNKNCPAYLILNDKDEVIVQSCEQHNHDEQHKLIVMDDCGDDEVAIILKDGTLKFNGYKYRKSSKESKEGTRWNCCVKACDAFLVVNDDDDIVSSEENHNHGSRLTVKDQMKVPAGKPKGVLITSRHGNKNLLYRGFYYRRKYSSKSGKIRWVCSSLKNCRACAITTTDLEVLRIFQEHNHGPPGR